MLSFTKAPPHLPIRYQEGLDGIQKWDPKSGGTAGEEWQGKDFDSFLSGKKNFFLDLAIFLVD